MNGAEVLTRFTADTSGVDKATKATSTSLGKLASAFTLGSVAASAINKAFSVMSANMDKAISRYDTMNNFPKVMKNLGISAQDAEDVIKQLSKDLQGLPTSLDAGARAVQRFTTVNGDIKKSRKLFVALNNAILAGGASAEIQASALEQFAQAFSKGKPDMMEWRTLLTAMPAQLKQVATAMGKTTDELGEGLRKGWISMEDFTDTMMKLNKEGVNGFASFEEQAKSSTGGISTSITNMKTATARGITNMIGKVNEALEPFGGLSGVIGNIGKTAEKVFSKIGDALSVVIPKVIQLFDVIKDHIDDLILIGSIIAGWKIASAVQKGVRAFQKMKVQLSLLKLEMGATNTVAGVLKYGISGLNAVIRANPIGFVIGLITTLVSVFIYLWNNCEGFRNFWIGLWDGIVSIAKTCWNGLKTVFEAIADSFKAIFGTMVDSAKAVWDAIVSSAKAVVDGIVNTWNMISSFFISIASWINTNVIQPTIAVVKPIFDFIINAVSEILYFFKNVALLIIAVVATIIEVIYNIVSAIVGFIWNYVLLPIINLITTVATFIWDIVSTIVGFIWDGLVAIFDFFMGIIQGIIDAITNIAQFIWGIITTVVDFVVGAFQTIWGFISSVFDGIKNIFMSIVDFVWGKVLKPIIDLFSKAFNTVAGAIKSVFNGVKKFFTNIFNTIGNIIKTPINGIIKGINAVIGMLNKIKVPDWVPGIGGAGINFKKIPLLNVGTNYVPEDTLAMIHKGEAVIPKKFNPYANGIDSSTLGSMNVIKPTTTVIVNAEFETDPLGQMVQKIKTFSGGAKNDYNYGMGVR